MASFIWMFIDDNDDAFKKYQRAYRKMEIETAEKKLFVEIEKIKDQRVSYDAKLLEAENQYVLKGSELDACILELDTAKAEFYKANMNFLGYKAIVDAEKYKFETAKLHAHDGKPLKIEKIYCNKFKT